MMSNKPEYDKTNKLRAPSTDWHPPSLIRVFAVRMKKPWILSFQLTAQRRLIRLGGCQADFQPDLCLRWAHISMCWFCHAAAQMKYAISKGPPVSGCYENVPRSR